MAPEVLSGSHYDFKADIWSLGVTMFEILTSSFPFPGKTKNQIF
jgi:serine/threonine protein kinase